jgi:hypothetical protein
MSKNMSGGQHDQETERNHDERSGQTRAFFLVPQLPLERFVVRRRGKEAPQDDRVGEENRQVFSACTQAPGNICFLAGGKCQRCDK